MVQPLHRMRKALLSWHENIPSEKVMEFCNKAMIKMT